MNPHSEHDIRLSLADLREEAAKLERQLSELKRHPAARDHAEPPRRPRPARAPSAAGRWTARQTAARQTAAGRPAAEQTAAEQTAAEQTAADVRSRGLTAVRAAASLTTAEGQRAAGSRAGRGFPADRAAVDAPPQAAGTWHGAGDHAAVYDWAKDASAADGWDGGGPAGDGWDGDGWDGDGWDGNEAAGDGWHGDDAASADWAGPGSAGDNPAADGWAGAGSADEDWGDEDWGGYEEAGSEWADADGTGDSPAVGSGPTDSAQSDSAEAGWAAVGWAAVGSAAAGSAAAGSAAAGSAAAGSAAAGSAAVGRGAMDRRQAAFRRVSMPGGRPAHPEPDARMAAAPVAAPVPRGGAFATEPVAQLPLPACGDDVGPDDSEVDGAGPAVAAADAADPVGLGAAVPGDAGAGARDAAEQRTDTLVSRGRPSAYYRGWSRGRKLAAAAGVALAFVIILVVVFSGGSASWPPSVAAMQSEASRACQNPDVKSEPRQVNFACAKSTRQVLWVFALLTSGGDPGFSDPRTGRLGLEPITRAQGGALAWSLNLHHPYNPANPVDSMQVAARAINNIIGGATVTGAGGNPVVQPGLESNAANCLRYTGSAALATRSGFPAVCAHPVSGTAGQAALVADVFQRWIVDAPPSVAQDAAVLFANARNPGDPQVQAILKRLQHQHR